MTENNGVAEVEVAAVVAKEVVKDESPIIFYCKDCEEVVQTARVGGKYVYSCKKCGTKNVAFGTRKSIYGFFRIEEREKEKLREKKRMEKMRQLKENKPQKEEESAEDLKNLE
ncbi:MAG: hypothetical protein AAB373_02430 [Patescibacteria group bacterium]